MAQHLMAKLSYDVWCTPHPALLPIWKASPATKPYNLILAQAYGVHPPAPEPVSYHPYYTFIASNFLSERETKIAPYSDNKAYCHSNNEKIILSTIMSQPSNSACLSSVKTGKPTHPTSTLRLQTFKLLPKGTLRIPKPLDLKCRFKVNGRKGACRDDLPRKYIPSKWIEHRASIQSLIKSNFRTHQLS